MSQIQVTLLQLDNYGPWTVTPEPRREMDLQSLQSRLFADVAQSIGNQEGYAFSSRFDNMIAVTNGLDRTDHRLLQETVRNRYPVTVSAGVATGTTPADALSQATDHLQTAGSAQNSDRAEILSGTTLEEKQIENSAVQVAHFDVIDATEKYTDQMNAFDALVTIREGYASLRNYLYDNHDALAFFVGGDNIIAICLGICQDDLVTATDHVKRKTGVELKVGIGTSSTAGSAGMKAKFALEECCKKDTLVEQH